MSSFVSMWRRLLSSKKDLLARFSLFSSFPSFSSENTLKICTGTAWKQHLFPYRTNWRLISRPVRGTCRRNHQRKFCRPSHETVTEIPCWALFSWGLGIFGFCLTGVPPSFLWLLWHLCFLLIFMVALTSLTYIVLQCPFPCLPCRLGGGDDALGWLLWPPQRPWRIRSGNRKFCPLNLPLLYCRRNRNSA